MEGFYAVYYTGVAGLGNAVLVFTDNIVSGADTTGGTYDGSYSVGDNNEIEIEIIFTIPAGGLLVTGQSFSEDYAQTITATLRSGFADGHSVLVQTPMGPVNAIFKKLRGMP